MAMSMATQWRSVSQSQFGVLASVANSNKVTGRYMYMYARTKAQDSNHIYM